MVTLKCTYSDDTFYQQLIDLAENYPFVTKVEGYPTEYSDTRRKGYLKCKCAFSAKKDPFVGVWIDDLPVKGFYTEAEECTFDCIKNYLEELKNDRFKDREDTGNEEDE